MSVLLGLMLLLFGFLSPVFSLAYTCACTHAYAYALVKTRLYGSAFITYGNEVESKEVQFPGQDDP